MGKSVTNTRKKFQKRKEILNYKLVLLPFVSGYTVKVKKRGNYNFSI